MVENLSTARSRTILVVEDERLLRVAVSMMLRNEQFSVLEAPDGTSAINLLRLHNDIDAVLLDFELPGASSREVFQVSQLLHPGLKVILTSACSQEAINASFDGLVVENFIQKPFRMRDLIDVLRRALPS